MPFSDAEIRRQLRLGEDGAWEFKQIEFKGNRPVSPGRSDLADEIAAFANADGGVLLCGVTDTGDVQGMSRGQMDELEPLLVEVCTDTIKPPVRPVILRRELEEGKPFLVVEVPQGHAQHDSPGGSFHRVGSSKRRMTSDERLRLAQRRGQARFLWFDKQAVPETGFRTLDESLWKPLLSAEGAADPELALEKMGLLSRGENGVTRATVAGVLLCSRAPEEWLPNACITATCYRGEDRATGQLDAQTIGGPLKQQISHAVAFAVRNMRVAAQKTPARAELPQYSEEAIFEAVVNAVAHRDYSIRASRIRLSMFSDRIEIQSPGALPNNLAVDDMPHRQPTRNELLTSLLGRVSAAGIKGAGGRLFIIERRGHDQRGAVGRDRGAPVEPEVVVGDHPAGLAGLRLRVGQVAALAAEHLFGERGRLLRRERLLVRQFGGALHRREAPEVPHPLQVGRAPRRARDVGRLSPDRGGGNEQNGRRGGRACE